MKIPNDLILYWINSSDRGSNFIEGKNIKGTSFCIYINLGSMQEIRDVDSFKGINEPHDYSDVTTAVSEVNTAVAGLAAINATDDVALQTLVDGTAKITTDANLIGTVSMLLRQMLFQIQLEILNLM